MDMSTNSRLSERLKKFASKAASAAVSISRPNYFDPKKDNKGELSGIRKDLASDLPVLRKEAIKKIIAHMTLGRDVSPLFADVIKCMQTVDIELKKLVYLYLINHAKSQPDLVILAINTFVKDTEDKNPMIRALAIRTMGCIRVARLLDHINEPLHRCSKDKDAYVRKTVAIAISKVYDLSPDFVDECGLLEVLDALLDDKNATVIASAVCSLGDIKPGAICKLPIRKLLLSMNGCNEWNLVSLLDAISEMHPDSEEDIELISEHCIPRLQHANSAVVMSSIKILLRTLVFMDEDIAGSVRRKICAALVTLVSTSQPELQWTILRNIRIIHQEHPDILAGQAKAFFCKYNEPFYVKIEKLEMLVQLYDMERFDVILGELMEYAKDVDQAFAKRAVSALGRLPLDHVVSKLRELVTSGIMLERCIIVINTLIDQRPAMFQDVLPDVIGASLSDPMAKVAQLRMVSQYAARGSELLLATYMENFEMEPLEVRLALIDAAFLALTKNPQCSSHFDGIVQKAEASSQDSLYLSEKASIYRRLVDQKLVVKQVASAMESIDNSASTPTTLENVETLMANLNSVVSALHHHVTGAKAHVPVHQESSTLQSLERDLLDFAWDDENRAMANPTEGVIFDSQMSSQQMSPEQGKASPIHSAPPSTNNLVDLLTGDI